MGEAGEAKYLWLDIETEGLDVETCAILEVAWIVTDAQLRERTRGVLLVCPSVVESFESEVVVDMHTRSGLIADRAAVRNALIDRQQTSIAYVPCYGDLDDELRRVVDAFGWADGRPKLAGSSVHFDRKFLSAHLGGFVADCLHYRQLDLSSITEALRDVLGPDAVAAVRPSIHRALPDVSDSLDRARNVYQMLGGLSIL